TSATTYLVRSLAAALLAAMLPICAVAPASAKNCVPVETRDPNAVGQKPAFPGQTRACGIASDVAFDVVVLAKGLQQPWAVEPLPDGDLLVTEKPGRMRVVTAKGQMRDPTEGRPPAV